MLDIDVVRPRAKSAGRRDEDWGMQRRLYLRKSVKVHHNYKILGIKAGFVQYDSLVFALIKTLRWVKAFAGAVSLPYSGIYPQPRHRG